MDTTALCDPRMEKESTNLQGKQAPEQGCCPTALLGEGSWLSLDPAWFPAAAGLWQSGLVVLLLRKEQCCCSGALGRGLRMLAAGGLAHSVQLQPAVCSDYMGPPERGLSGCNWPGLTSMDLS